MTWRRVAVAGRKEDKLNELKLGLTACPATDMGVRGFSYVLQSVIATAVVTLMCINVG